MCSSFRTARCAIRRRGGASASGLTPFQVPDPGRRQEDVGTAEHPAPEHGAQGRGTITALITPQCQPARGPVCCVDPRVNRQSNMSTNVSTSTTAMVSTCALPRAAMSAEIAMIVLSSGASSTLRMS